MREDLSRGSRREQRGKSIAFRAGGLSLESRGLRMSENLQFCKVEGDLLSSRASMGLD